ncbi:MAG: ABC transporter substrate-binding protein [Anaerolineae bacterium]|nr:ABC transporter substrate-binding protein [Anaerolineae bacterium]
MQHRSRLQFVSLLVITGLLLAACSGAPKPKTYIIGVASEPRLDTVLDGFKAKMTELGYVEGENITYIYRGELGTDVQENEAEIEYLMGQKANLLLTLGQTPTVAVKKAVEDTNMPVVFAPAMNPVENELVANISHPGSNITGIQVVSTNPKALEWLLKIVPDARQVYIPYHPADRAALMSIKSLPDVAVQLGIELILDEVSDRDEELAAIKALPKDAAILFTISPSLNASLDEALKLAVELCIPAGASNSLAQDKMLFNYSTDLTQTGKQAAVLVDKIFDGIKPGDLPVETAESLLTINLRTAEAIDLDIPEEILHHAQKIIR